jgi:glycerol-1-phosphatase
VTSALVDGYAGVVCDLDGVVYRGPEAVDHAVGALTALTVPVVYATNNASRPPGEVAAHLSDLGLRATSHDVVTSSQAGAAALAAELAPGAVVLAVGGPGVREALRECGLQVITPAQVRQGEQHPPIDGVLQGYGTEVTAADLAEAAYAVADGARWVATNTDETLPTHRGTAPGNGTLVAAVARAVGQQPTVVGKPQAPLYHRCAARLGVDARRVLAVGDRLDTDIAGAVAAGMDSALVLTGVDSVSSLAVAPRAQRPRFLVEDLRALAQKYVPAETDYSWWVCGDERRRLVDGRWDVASTGSPIESARAGIAALHEALDLHELAEADARQLVSSLDRWQ